MMRPRRSVPAAVLAAMLLAGLSASRAQDAPSLQGTTHLRLDAVDTSRSPKGEFLLFASFLDKYRKPITVTDAAAWKITFNGEPVTGELAVKQLSESEQGVAVVVVAAAYQAFQDEWFEHTRNGVQRLLNGLRAADLSALVTFGDSVEATGGLSPSHNEAVGWLSERKVDGMTPLLFEAIEKGLEFFPSDLTTVGPNRALVVISDGWDKYSLDNEKMRDQVQKVQRLAKKRNVRINVIGVTIGDSSSLQELQKIAHYTGGTYRPAAAAPGIEEYLGHLQAELTRQHVLYFKPDDFEGDRETTFKVEVMHEQRAYASGPLIAYVAPRESHLLTYVLIGAGGLAGLVLLIVIIRLIVRVVRSRGEDEVVEEGPELLKCGQCGNMIPVAWKVCQYCEALPHKGRLTVISVGELNGRTFFLKDSLTNIGSAPGNTVVLPDKSVSKRHAGIKIQDDRFELADFGSTNGVLVNGQRITKQFLKSGDVLTIGAVELEFTLK